MVTNSPPPSTNPANQFTSVTFCTTCTLTSPTTTVTTTSLTVAPLPNLNVKSPTQTITVRPPNDPEFVFGPLSDTVIAGAATQLGTSVDDIDGLLADPKTSNAEMAILLPYYFTQLHDILNQPQSSWTYAQTTFVNDILNFINQQRQQAAIQAENDYNAWYRQQYAKQQALLAGLTGPAYVEMSQILASNPPIPPPSLIEEAQLGMYMTPSQALTYAGIQGATAALADSVSKMENQPPDAVVTEVENAAGFTGGAISDVAKITNEVTLLAGVIASSKLNGLIDTAQLATKSGDVLDLKVGQTLKDLVEINTLNPDELDAINAAEEAVQTAAKVSKFISAGALAFELAGNALQAVTGIAEYSALAYFNTSFNNAVNANLKPLTVSSLKDMDNNSSTQVYSYLINMMAAGNKITPPLIGPTTPQSVYESL